MPMGEQKIVVSEGRGFQMMGGQSREMPAERAEQQVSDLGRNLLFLARYASDVEAVAAGEGEVDGAPCSWVEVALGAAKSRLCVAADGKVLEQTFQSSHPFTGAPGNFEIVYSDYREIGGFLVPHVQSTKIDGVDFSTTTRQSAEINPDVDEALFERPAA